MNDSSPQDHAFMQRALALAEQAAEQQEVPVGAVIVLDDQIIGEGQNSPIGSTDTTAHAEINALRQACETVNNYRLPNSTLYVTLEPCAMCAGAIVHARVSRVVIATKEPRAGAAGSVLNILNHENLNHRCKVDIGLMQSEASQQLKQFFKARRKS